MGFRGLLTVLALILFVGTAFSLPSTFGLRGVNKVLDARTIGENQIAFSLITRYWTSADEFSDLDYIYRVAPTINVWRDTVLSVEDTEHVGEGFFAVDYGVTSFMELAARVSYVLTAYEYDLTPPRNQSIGQWDNINGMGDALLGVKFGFSPTPANELLWLGIDNWFAFAPKTNQTVEVEEYDGMYWEGTPHYAMRRPSLSTGHTSYGVGGLISLDMAQVWPGTPLRSHINVGYSHYKQTVNMMDYQLVWDDSTGIHIENGPQVGALVEDNAMDIGFALEFPTEFAVIFTEFTMKNYLDRDEYNSVAYFTPGIRVFSGGGVILDFCFNLGLTDFDPSYFDFGHALYDSLGSVSMDDRVQRAPLPDGGTQDWGIAANIAFSSDLIDRGPVITTGNVSGMVTELGTGLPLQATVSFPGTPVASVITDPATGFFTATLPAGSVPVTVSAPGYHPASATVVLEAGQDVVVDFALELMPAAGTVAGTVTEFENNTPLQATVTVIDTPEPITVEATVDGVYQLTAPAGTWTIKAEADGYVSRSQPVVVGESQTAIVDFVLRPALETGQVLSFNNIYFDSGSSTIKPESYSVLNNIAEILLENTSAMVQIAGHTDSDGSESYNQGLSEQRASSVFTYLVQRGVSASRMTTLGFGESNPVVPNNSAANKAMNRRIEFTVLSN
jgi:outer membrane protein OmpA-like peptidoglycan-associated protein